MKELVTEIQSLGIRVPDKITGRRSGAGPAEGRAFVVGGRAVMAPIGAPFARRSPYGLEETGGDRFMLLRNGEPVIPVSVVPDPRFYQMTGSDGTDHRDIA